MTNQEAYQSIIDFRVPDFPDPEVRLRNFVKKCEQRDLEESLDGGEDADVLPYISNRLTEYSTKELAEIFGESYDGMKKQIYRSQARFERRLLIATLMKNEPVSNIVGIIVKGETQKVLRSLF